MFIPDTDYEAYQTRKRQERQAAAAQSQPQPEAPDFWNLARNDGPLVPSPTGMDGPAPPSFVPSPTGMDGPAGQQPPAPDAVQRAMRWRDALNEARQAPRPSINDAVAAAQARGEIVGNSPLTPPARPSPLEVAGATVQVPAMTYSRAVTAPIAEIYTQMKTVPKETPGFVSPSASIPGLPGLRRPLLPAEQQNIGDIWQAARGDNAVDKWGSLGERFQQRYETNPWGSLAVEAMVDPLNALGTAAARGIGNVAAKGAGAVVQGLTGPGRAGSAAAAQIAGRAVKQFGGAWAVAENGSRVGPLAETATEAIKQFETLSGALPKAKAQELAHFKRVAELATSPTAKIAKQQRGLADNPEVARYAAEQIKRLDNKPLMDELAGAARATGRTANEIITMPGLKRLLPAASIEDVGQAARQPWQIPQADFVAARQLPGRSSLETTVDKLNLWLPEIKGAPGIQVLDNSRFGPSAKVAVFRDANGAPQGVLVHSLDEAGKGLNEVAVAPAFQRQGVATKLYKALEDAGYDVNAARGAGGYTEAGAAMAHRQAVARALAEGQTVPPEVLRDYPKLGDVTPSAASMGSAPEISGAIVGGAVYQDDPNLTPAENFQRRALAALGGGVLAHGAKRLGSSNRLGGTIEPVNSSNAANRALGNMYANPSSGPGGGLWGKAESARIAMVRAFTDEGVDLAKFQQQAAKAKGAPLAMDEMAAELRRLNADKAAEVHLQEGLQPAIKAVGKDRAWLSVYLTHQDNIDVARAMGNANRSFSGGLTVADSRQALVDMAAELGPARMKVIQDAADQTVAFGQSLLKRKLDSGVITQQLYDDLVNTYPNYVPTRITDYLKDPVGIPNGKSLSVRDTGLRRNTVEGTTRAREDPLASMVRNAYQTEALARKNEAFEAFIKLRDMNPEAQTLIRPVADSYTATRYEAKVTGFVRGQRVTYAMPKALEIIVKGEPKAVLPGFAGAIWGAMMGTFRAAATTRNPLFLAGNATLDAATYAIRETIRAGGPQHLPKVIAELVKAYGDAFGGVLQGSYHGNTAQFLKSGGGQFGYFQGTQGAARQSVEGLARNSVFSINSASDIKRLTLDVATFKPVEGLGERIELAPRVASYNLAKGRGVNNVQATINGRTVTIDFQQGGNFTKVVNQFVPFFNVGVQASVQPVRAFRENPKGAIATAAALLAGPTIAAEAWNRSDPQRARDYQDVPQYLKDQGIVIMVPGDAPVDAQGNRHPQFAHIRMREFAPFTTLTREAAARALGDEPREWADLLAGTLGSVSPIQGSNPADALASFTPLGASTGLQLATNKDFFRNRMIATKGGDERAAALSKAVAKALNVQPSQVDFAIRDLGAGLGSTALAASDFVAGKPNSGSPQDTPVVGGLYRRFVRGDTGDRLDKARQKLITPANKAALKAAGVELNLGPVGYTISDVPLRNNEQEQYQVTTNQYINEEIEKALATPNWDQYSPEQRDEVVRNHVQTARDRAAMKIKQLIGTEELKRRRAANAGG